MAGVAALWAAAVACDGGAAAGAERGASERGGTARARDFAAWAAAPPCDVRWIASTARAVDADGAVVGSVLGADTTEHPAVWAADGLHDLGLPPGATHAEAVALTGAGTDTGAVVVNAWRRVPGAPDPQAEARAYVWRAGRWVLIDGLPHAAAVYATAANARSVVGYFLDSALETHAFAWRGRGQPAAVLTVEPGGASAAAVNDAGVVVGGAGRAVAFVWRPGTASDSLEYLFHDPPAPWSFAAGVSRTGLVVGRVMLRGAPGPQPFVFRPASDLRRVGRVAVPARGGEYTAVSPHSTLRVGHDNARHAFVASDAGTRTLAAVPGFDEARPAAVNDAGVVVGTASLPDPTRASYVPGPGTRAVAWHGTAAPRLLPLTPARCVPDSVGAGPTPRHPR